MKRPACLLAASYILAAALAASAAPYTAVDLYTLGPPIPNPGGGSIFGFGGGGYFAAAGQVVTVAVGPASATLYSPPAGTTVDLTPTSPENSGAYLSATNGAYQVGNANYKPMLWHGTSASAIELGDFGNAVGISPDGTQQVGFTAGATLWNGTAASAVSLDPTNLTGYFNSYAVATNGVKQVGYASGAFSRIHALMWNGTADSTVDLDPTHLSYLTHSFAVGISGNGSQQVGIGTTLDAASNQLNHALLWNGTADSAIDLHPADLTESLALGTNGSVQIGFGTGPGTNDNGHALLWTGTAASVFDLNALLPFAATASFADSIDSNGNIFGTAVDAAGNIHAVEWSPIPEPATFALTALGALPLLSRRRRTRGAS